MNCNIIIFLILILILIINLKHIFNNKVKYYFLNKNELSYILLQDKDKFYTSLSNKNLLLRNITNKDNFLKSISKHLYTLSDKEKYIITKAIKKADKKLKKIKYPGFNYLKLKNYNWIIGCSIGDKYEFGYPHTRNNIIILNYNNNVYDKNLYKTLIHERVHIYQKLFPNDIKLFLQYFQFKKIKLQNEDNLANPDTDEYIYSLNNNNFECIIKNNLDLNYTDNNYKCEHPYEFMAYLISENS